MKYGYARVSTYEQDLSCQIDDLKIAGAEKIYSEKFTGTKDNRPIFNELLKVMKTGDELIVTKLDRFSRSVQQGTTLVKNLLDKGIIVNILNMGKIDTTPTGSLMLNMFLAFSQFERDMIVQRTQEGKAHQQKINPDFKDGRRPKKNPKQIKEILEYLKSHTYKQTSELFGIDKSTIVRYRQKYS